MEKRAITTHQKEKLTIPEQIEHLKNKGVTFTNCTEDRAATYLADDNYYFRVTAYRSLFEKRKGGAHDGEYVGLDFADLIELSNLDRELRELMLPMTIAVEHAAKVQVIHEVTGRENEDGYSIINEYLRSLPEDTRRRRINEFMRLKDSEYSSEIIRKYDEEVPIWLYLEFSSFGAFVSLYRFCALRWDDEAMLYRHYLLRQCVAMRNASAHGLPIINGFTKRQSSIKVGASIAQAVADAGISKRVRTAKLKNPRIQQIVTVAYLYTHTFDMCQQDSMVRNVQTWRSHANAIMATHPTNDTVCSSLGFLLKIFDKWF